MKIRGFSTEDFAAVSQLWRRSGIEIRPGDNREDLRRKLERDSDLFLVAEENSKIVGSVMGTWDGRRGWIYHLAVDPKFRRKHIARKMLLEVERRMQDKGVPRVNTMVYLWNGPSLNFFEALGYKKQVDLAVMGKTLGGGKHCVKTVDSGRKRRRSRPGVKKGWTSPPESNPN